MEQQQSILSQVKSIRTNFYDSSSVTSDLHIEAPKEVIEKILKLIANAE